MNLLDMYVKLSVDDSGVDKGLGRAKEKALSFGDVLKANVLSGATTIHRSSRPQKRCNRS